MSINTKDLKTIVDIIARDPDLSINEKKKLFSGIEQANIPEDILNKLLEECIMEKSVKDFKGNKRQVEYDFHRKHKCYGNNPYRSETTRYRLRRK